MAGEGPPVPRQIMASPSLHAGTRVGRTGRPAATVSVGAVHLLAGWPGQGQGLAGVAQGAGVYRIRRQI